MRKGYFTAAKTMMVAAALSCILAVPAMAGSWKQDQGGWWYQNDDMSYPKNGWNWVEGKCYYFTPDGYCLINTQTPDGYTVDASGAWIVNGVVQTQAGQTTVAQAGTQQDAGTNAALSVGFGSQTVSIPAGFTLREVNDTAAAFVDQNETHMVMLLEQSVGDYGNYNQLISQVQEYIIDMAMQQNFGAPTSKTTLQTQSGAWYSYYYQDIITEIRGSAKIYARIVDTRLQMIAVAGDLNTMDADAFMYNNVR